MRNVTVLLAFLLASGAVWAGEETDVARYTVYKNDQPVLRVIDRPGPLTSTALLPYGATPVSHPYLTASALAPTEEHQLRGILDTSDSTADFLDNLRKAGYLVRRE